MDSFEFGTIIFLIFLGYLVQRRVADELYAKFEKLLDDRVRILKAEIADLKKQHNQSESE